MRQTGGRHELKHYINYADFVQLRSRLQHVASPDENAYDGNSYKVRSLYFDNYNDKALLEKINGLDQREKFRLRLYNDDSAFIRLEKKSKKGGMCFKESAVISASDCEGLLKGDFTTLKENGAPLLLELYTKMYYEQLRPKNIVDYNREAYLFNAGNVRITLDTQIRTSSNVSTFLNPNIITVPLPNVIILEVKYDNFLPEIIRGITSLSSRQSTAFSKYAVTRII
ncbi:MAG: polyphosphate polymerase domain-containing protein [Clostridium sp.]|uniref:polyphosphate polymerase domain-containing protein n=1 Tax=Clostridium sp. TaxID=1506 RepID=UPI0030361D63